MAYGVDWICCLYLLFGSVEATKGGYLESEQSQVAKLHPTGRWPTDNTDKPMG